MPPTSSKPLAEQRPPGIRKRTLAPILADPDNVDVAAIKRRKLEAILHQQRQPSVETILNDPDDSPPPNYPPRKASTILEAADGSDDDEIMGDVGLESSQFANESSGVSDNSDRDGDEEEDGDHDGDEEQDGDEEEDGDLEDEEESEDAELGEHSYIFQQSNTHLWPFVSTIDWRLDIAHLCILRPCSRYHLRRQGPPCPRVSLHGNVLQRETDRSPVP